MHKKPIRFFCIIFLSEGRRKEVKSIERIQLFDAGLRREIERMYVEGERAVDIAARLKRPAAASTRWNTS